MRTASWTDAVSVLDRMSALFDAFGGHDEGLGISELARRAGLPKSTVSRIATELVAQGFLDRDGDKLYLGVRLWELGQTVQQPRELRKHALPVMRQLRDATRMTVSLGVLDKDDVIVIAVLQAPSFTPPPLRIGARLPAHATAMGKSILAFSNTSVAAELAAGTIERRMSGPITDPTILVRELAAVRMRGVATDPDEYLPEATGAASPVLDPTGSAIAAISVSGPTVDFRVDTVVPAVRAAAMTLSRRLQNKSAL